MGRILVARVCEGWSLVGGACGGLMEWCCAGTRGVG